MLTLESDGEHRPHLHLQVSGHEFKAPYSLKVIGLGLQPATVPTQRHPAVAVRLKRRD